MSIFRYLVSRGENNSIEEFVSKNDITLNTRLVIQNTTLMNYVLFRSFTDLFDFYLSQDVKTYNEIIKTSCVCKIFFDIDDSMCGISDNDIIIFNERVKSHFSCNTMVFTSSTDDKSSYHIICDVGARNIVQVGYRVKDFVKISLNDGCSISSFVDTCVYKSNQALRLWYSCKPNKNNVKVLLIDTINNTFTNDLDSLNINLFKSSLVSSVDCIKFVFMDMKYDKEEKGIVVLENSVKNMFLTDCRVDTFLQRNNYIITDTKIQKYETHCCVIQTLNNSGVVCVCCNVIHENEKPYICNIINTNTNTGLYKFLSYYNCRRSNKKYRITNTYIKACKYKHLI